MWDDRRLTAAIAALPPEAFIEGPAEDGDLLWRRAAKRLRAGATQDPHDEGQIAPVVRLPLD